jgi:hypothetical protein
MVLSCELINSLVLGEEKFERACTAPYISKCSAYIRAAFDA